MKELSRQLENNMSELNWLSRSLLSSLSGSISYGSLHPSEFGNNDGKIIINSGDIEIIGNIRLAARAVIDYSVSFNERHQSWNMISFEIYPFVFCFTPIIKIKKNTFSIIDPKIDGFVEEVNRQLINMKAFL